MGNLPWSNQQNKHDLMSLFTLLRTKTFHDSASWLWVEMCVQTIRSDSVTDFLGVTTTQQIFFIGHVPVLWLM